ncbi:hypothetical protein BN2476_830084 [Paraburkholderia piptadeniae]|uniref:Uncharacterized protein n=1 Tax=Paraburkholderia piptadeniae TaxID=1701573 RepID=A0A1N7ST01_9BURK|nr:hypothetical protein BN2476_830084 [Paraburkholderia piptadeniae]
MPYNLFFDADAGWSSLAARRAHNPKVVGSNPTPATKFSIRNIRRIIKPAIGGFFVLGSASFPPDALASNRPTTRPQASS